MRDTLDSLRKAIGDFAEPQEMSAEEWQGFIDNCVVVLPVGGAGTRLQAVTGAQVSHKTALLLSSGDTMVQRTIRMYRDAGLREFVALVFHEAHSVVELLGDGRSLDVIIRYSYDPEQPVGRGGAIRNALENGAIPASKSLIVHNPDDQIVNYPRNFPQDIVRAHMTGQHQGRLATVVVVDSTTYAYTGMKVVQGVVEQVEMYPQVPIPAHIGVTLFSPKVYPYFRRLFDLRKKTDFEAVLLPALVQDGLLYATAIPAECWIPVNDPKALQQLEAALQQGA